MEQIGEDGTVITIIHFAYLREPVGKLPENTEEKSWRLACMPNMVELHQTKYHPNYQHTNDPRGVTCPGCKASEIYKQEARTYQP